jgi:putative ABC transport system ATP-binding protein
MAIVALENLCKAYKIGSSELFVLRDVSLSIEQGEYVAIMGPSGSGKSTLLNVLGCLDRPTRGTYQLAGQDVSNLDDNGLSMIRGSQIGFIFQSYNLIAQLNAVENIEVPMYYQGFSERGSADRAKELAKMVGLGDRIRHRPAELSGGEQQRVAIARAMANDPRIILADEPTGNLDSESGLEIMKILGDLHKRGRTLVIVTHDPNIAKKAEKTIYLLDGQIERQKYNRKR